PQLLRRPPEKLNWIAAACHWHVAPDWESHWDHPVLWYLKDADGLDRVRLFDLEPDMLRHDGARRWIPQAEQLFAATEDEQDPLVIWETALSQGLPVTDLVEWVGRQANNLAAPVGGGVG